MQKCLPQPVLPCSFQHFKAVSFSASDARYILCLVCFCRKGSLAQASLSEALLLHCLPPLPHHVRNTCFGEESYLFWPPSLQTQQAAGPAGSGRRRVWVWHNLKLCVSKP